MNSNSRSTRPSCGSAEQTTGWRDRQMYDRALDDATWNEAKPSLTCSDDGWEWMLVIPRPGKRAKVITFVSEERARRFVARHDIDLR